MLLALLFSLALALSARNCSAQTCPDKALWDHVYNPQRLTVHAACITVTGVIVDATAERKHPKKDGLRHEADGDTHGWLKLDPGQDYLLNAGNVSSERGNLVFEVVCKYKVTQKDAKAACRGYQSDITIPPVGSHVRMTGSWVMDDNHLHWNELHPVSLIEVIPATLPAKAEMAKLDCDGQCTVPCQTRCFERKYCPAATP